MFQHRRRASRLTTDRDLGGITTEGSDLLGRLVKSCLLVNESIISRSTARTGVAQFGVRKKSKSAKPVVH